MKDSKILIIFLFIFTIIFSFNCSRGKTSDNSTGKTDFKTGSIIHDDMERTYYYYIPSGYDKSKSLPLVIALHGGGGTGKGINKATGGFNDIAEKETFIIVYPDGVEKHWNDGRGVSQYTAQKENIDDTGFISSFIDYFIEEFNADKNRVYVTGISNGGLMSYRLAFELPQKIAAFAPVIANLQEELVKNYSPNGPVPILIMNGTEDPLMPFNGGDIHFYKKKLGKVISTEETVKFWVKENNCSQKPEITWLEDKDPSDGTRVKREVYSGGDNGTEVILYTIEGGGHTWPGGSQYLPEKIIGKTCRDINGCQIIWDFFKKHSKIVKGEE